MKALWIIGASLSFALMATCIKLADERGAPLGQVLFYRSAGSLLLVCLQMGYRRVPFATPHWRRHLLRGVASFVSMIVLFSAIRLLPLATAITLSFLSPVILAGLLVLLHGEQPTRRLLSALGTAIVGVVLLLRPTIAAQQWSGALVGLASAVLGAVAMLNMRAIGRLDEPAWRSVFYFSLISSILALPWYLASHPLAVDPEALGLMLLSAVFATGGQVMQTRAYEHRNTLLVSLLSYSQVLFTSIIGALLFRHAPTTAWWLGMLLVVGSGALAVLGPGARRSGAPGASGQ